MIFIPLFALLLLLYRFFFLKPGHVQRSPLEPKRAVAELSLPDGCATVLEALEKRRGGGALLFDASGTQLATVSEVRTRALAVARGLVSHMRVSCGDEVSVDYHDQRFSMLDLVCIDVGCQLAGCAA